MTRAKALEVACSRHAVVMMDGGDSRMNPMYKIARPAPLVLRSSDSPLLLHHERKGIEQE